MNNYANLALPKYNSHAFLMLPLAMPASEGVAENTIVVAAGGRHSPPKLIFSVLCFSCQSKNILALVKGSSRTCFLRNCGIIIGVLM